MRPWLAGSVFLILALDAWTKGPGNLSDMLWACHWGSVLIGLGILAGSGSAVCAGLLFQMTLGIPAWLLGLLFSGELHHTSVLVHSFPPLAALLYLRGLQTLPRYLAVRAWLLHPAALLVSIRYAKPELNVNMATEPWPPLAHLFPDLASFHVALVSLSLLMLSLMERAWRRWLGERKARPCVSVEALSAGTKWRVLQGRESATRPTRAA